jgi:hypothetical protein
VVWRPDSDPSVDLRYRGTCDPASPDALFSYITVYLYNLTNLAGMRLNGEKPQVVGRLVLICRVSSGLHHDDLLLSLDTSLVCSYCAAAILWRFEALLPRSQAKQGRLCRLPCLC